MENKVLRQEILDLVLNTINNFCVENSIPLDNNFGEELKLFGGDGLLDSIGLVGLVVTIEEDIDDKFNKSIILADEKAMSRRTSPFARVSYLVDYIYELLNDEM
jgi:D-alanine--poly(phosphoribitol) ligase subunit 2